MAHPDCIVVGGGLVGAAAARALGRAGRRVLLLEPGGTPGAASAAAAGMLAPQVEAHAGDAMLPLALAGGEHYRALVGELERNGRTSIGYHSTGIVLVTLDDARVAELTAQVEAQRAMGLAAEGSRIALRQWCFAFWAACASKKGVSALQIRRQTGVSYKSALFMMHRIRYAMAPDEPTAPKLTGTVEVDETWVGGKPRPRSFQEWRRLRAQGLARVPNAFSNKVPVVAMIERGGQVRAQVVADVTARTVGSVLLANVSPDAHVRTDEGGHYKRIGRRYASHLEVKHGLREYVRGDASVNAAESFFARLKRQLYGTHHAVSKRHLHRYVAEVAFKHNTRKLDDGERVRAAIRAVDGKRLMYKQPSGRVTA